jgi:hypothetical protein
MRNSSSCTYATLITNLPVLLPGHSISKRFFGLEVKLTKIISRETLLTEEVKYLFEPELG